MYWIGSAGTTGCWQPVVAPLVVCLILLPFRDSVPNTSAALLLVLVVGVASAGDRLAGRAVGRAGVRLLPDPAVRELGHRLRCGCANDPAPAGGGRRGHRARLPRQGATCDGQ